MGKMAVEMFYLYVQCVIGCGLYLCIIVYLFCFVSTILTIFKIIFITVLCYVLLF